MSIDLHLEVCPETGICTIIRGDNTKIDLMPDEVEAIREAGGDAARISAVLAESDAGFAAGLSPVEAAHIGQQLQ